MIVNLIILYIIGVVVSFICLLIYNFYCETKKDYDYILPFSEFLIGIFLSWFTVIVLIYNFYKNRE